jgi:hypothetical protein
MKGVLATIVPMMFEEWNTKSSGPAREYPLIA